MIRTMARTLHGYEDKPGLVTLVKNLQTEMVHMNVLLTNHMDHIREDINDIREEMVAIKNKKDEGAVRWPYLLDKFLAPILTSILTAIILYLLLGNK